MLFFLGVDLAEVLLKNVPTFGVGGIKEKLEWYTMGRSHQVDTAGLAFVVMYTLVVGWILVAAKDVVYTNRYMFSIYNFAVLFLPFQVFFLNYSVFRNRMLYVGMMLALIILTEYFSRQSLCNRFVVFSVACLVSISYFSLFLMSSSGVPFVPYQSVVGVAITESPGDGYERLMTYIESHR
jgi:hypothetical protein